MDYTSEFRDILDTVDVSDYTFKAINNLIKKNSVNMKWASLKEKKEWTGDGPLLMKLDEDEKKDEKLRDKLAE